MPPASTYRLQLGDGFGFADAAAVADYLAALGVSHVYSSPYLQAAAGSSHGYDVVDPQRLSDDLGGVDGHTAMVSALTAAGLGQIVDIVPNHMAADPANRWWWDVLEHGRQSRYASFFDIDWESGVADTVLVPILDAPLPEVIAAGKLTVERDGDRFTLRYQHHRLPLAPSTVAEWRHLGDAEIAAINADAVRLGAIAADQHYRLADWRRAAEDLDYRRFFDVDSLVGLRVEDPDVFAATHSLILDLVAGGVVDGLRIDHVDGLREPGGYLRRLADATGGGYLVVEKILAAGERLPPSWPVAGTTGYEFLNRVNGLFVDPDAEAAFTETYAAFTGEDRSFAEIARAARHDVMGRELTAEVERVVSLLEKAGGAGHPRAALDAALRELVANFPVYRTYVTPGRVVAEADRSAVAAAVRGAASARPDLDPALLHLIADVALGTETAGDAAALTARFQQLTPAVMAKGVEDTAFYRYHRFVALNEVGGDPGRFGTEASAFHDAAAATAADHPDTLLTLSTHDTKRSGDVRARLAVLSRIPTQWRRAVERWTRGRSPGRVDANTEYLLYQTVVGAWPVDADRIAAYMAKATKEAKVHTSWVEPDPDYDAAVERYTRDLLADPAFISDIAEFLGEHRIVERGRRNSLAQTTLLLTSPGIPDVYQGTELWDLSLVDPDNRRPVDFARRRRLLAAVIDGERPAGEDGGIKLWLIHRLLDLRRSRPHLFASPDYEPLAVHGDDAVVAFTRGALAVVVPCRRGGSTGDATVDLPTGRWRSALTGADVAGGRLRIADLASDFPTAVLVRDRP